MAIGQGTSTGSRLPREAASGPSERDARGPGSAPGSGAASDASQGAAEAAARGASQPVPGPLEARQAGTVVRERDRTYGKLDPDLGGRSAQRAAPVDGGGQRRGLHL